MKSIEVKHGQLVRLVEYGPPSRFGHERKAYIGRWGLVDLAQLGSNRDFPWITLEVEEGIWWEAEGLELSETETAKFFQQPTAETEAQAEAALKPELQNMLPFLKWTPAKN